MSKHQNLSKYFLKSVSYKISLKTSSWIKYKVFTYFTKLLFTICTRTYLYIQLLRTRERDNVSGIKINVKTI